MGIKDRRGLSPIIAIILLISMVIASTGMVAVIFSGLVPSAPPPETEVGLDKVYFKDNLTVLKLINSGGDPLETKSLSLIISGTLENAPENIQQVQYSVSSLSTTKQRVKASGSVGTNKWAEYVWIYTSSSYVAAGDVLLITIEGERENVRFNTVSATSLVHAPSGGLLFSYMSPVSVGTGLPPPPPPPPPPEFSRLRVEGNRILRENDNQPVILRGVAVPDPYWIISNNNHPNEADFQVLATQWNANVVRIPVRPGDWKTMGASYFTYLDSVISWCKNNGMYAIVDWHALGNPVTGTSDKSGGDNENWTPNFSLAQQWWESAAEKYKNENGVLYDIFNEPAKDYNGVDISWTQWKPLAENLVSIIQNHNPKALILVGGIDYARDFFGVKRNPIERENIVYVTHPYWKPSTADYDSPQLWNERFGFLARSRPIMIGEWGYEAGYGGLSGSGYRTTYANPLLNWAENRSISWIGWIWSDSWWPPMIAPGGWNASPYTLTDFGQLAKDRLAPPPQPWPQPPSPSAGWWNTSWRCRKPITIRNSLNPSSLVNYQVEVRVKWDDDMKENFSDIRFVDNDQSTVLNYWIENYISTANYRYAIVWVKVPNIPANTDKIIYMYYGNASASSAENFDNVFVKDFKWKADGSVDANLVGQWLLDEGSGTTAIDTSTYGNNGAFKATPNWRDNRGRWDNRGNVIFSTGSALEFDASPDNVEVPDSASLNPTTAITMEAWVFSNDWFGQIAGKERRLENRGYILGAGEYIDENRTKFVFRLGTGGTSGWGAFWSDPIRVNQWHYIAANWSNSDNKIRLFIDGRLYTYTQSFTGLIVNTTGQPFSINRCFQSGEAGWWGATDLQGTIDEVRVYNRALHRDEIEAHYERRRYTPADPIVTTVWGEEITTGEPNTSLTAYSPDPTNDSTPTYSGTATYATSNIVDIEYRVDGGAWTNVDSFTPAPTVNFTFTTSALSNGTHTIETRAQNAIGTWETSYASDTLTVDTNEPNTSLTAYSPDPTNDSTPTYSGTATDATTNVVDIEYRVDAGAWTDVTPFTPGLTVNFTFTTSALADGAHTIQTRAKDSANNWETSYASDTLTTDVTQPNTTLTPYSPDPTSDPTPTYSGTATDATTNIIDIEYRVDGGAWANVDTFTPGLNVNFTFTVSPSLADGIHTIETRAMDSASNWETSYASDTLTVSSGEPNTSLTAYSPDPTNDSTPTYSGTATDFASNVVDIEYRVDGGAWINVDTFTPALTVNFTFTVSPAMGNGTHTVQTRAQNAVGNWETTYASDTLTVDTNEPNTLLTAYSPDPTNDSTPTYSGTATDATTNVVDIEYRVDAGTWTNVNSFTPGLTVNFTFTTSALADGTHTIYTRAMDSASNWETTYASDTLTVDATPPTAPQLVSPANNAAITTSIFKFDWNASTDSGSGVSYYTLQVDDDPSFSSLDLEKTTSASVTEYTLLSTEALLSNTYNWRVRAVDAVGNPGNWSTWVVRIDNSMYGFETSAQGWLPSGTITGAVWDTSKAKYGNGSLRCTEGSGTLDGYALVSSSFNFETTPVSVWVWFPPEAAGVMVEIVSYSPWGEGGWYTVAAGDTGKWIQLTGTLTANSTQFGVKIYTDAFHAPSWAGDFWIDAYDWVDFNISVNPGSGSVLPGGSPLTTTVFVNSFGNYQRNNTVSLTAESVPANVTVGFAPTNGRPPFSSTMTVTVGALATPGIYNIVIRGTGTDGKTHTRTYVLNVLGAGGTIIHDFESTNEGFTQGKGSTQNTTRAHNGVGSIYSTLNAWEYFGNQYGSPGRNWTAYSTVSVWVWTSSSGVSCAFYHKSGDWVWVESSYQALTQNGWTKITMNLSELHNKANVQEIGWKVNAAAGNAYFDQVELT